MSTNTAAARAQRLRRIGNLALPIVAATIATHLMNFVDALMVGRLGDAALAGVGLGGQFLFLLLAVALGLAAGVQALVAKRVGEDRPDRTGPLLNAGLVLALGAGLLLMLLGYPLTTVVLGVVSDDPRVVQEGLAYLYTRLPSLLFVSMNIAFRAYWVGVSLARWSMISIISLSLANVLFNYALIFGNFGLPRLEAAGAGLGSTLATLVGLLVNWGLAVKFARPNGFLRGLPSAPETRRMLRIAYPESLRQLFFSSGVVLFYVLVAQIGTRELAAFYVIISICQIAYLPHLGISGAATTLVGEAVGRRDLAEAQTWGWQVTAVGVVVLSLAAATVIVLPAPLLSLFLIDPTTLALAVVPLQLAVFAHVLDGAAKVLSAAFIGAGVSAIALRLTVVPQWLLLLPLVWLVVQTGGGLRSAMLVFLAAMAVGLAWAVFAWQQRKWQQLV